MTQNEYAKAFQERLAAANDARAAVVDMLGSGQVSPDTAAIAFSNLYIADVIGLVVCELAHHRLKDELS